MSRASNITNCKNPPATVVVTTKNRLAELRKAVASALAQTVEPEILVIDDGSTDGTAEVIRQEFPSVNLQQSQQSLGYIVQRNRAARLAKGTIVFSIDDDAVFTSPRVIEQTLCEFDHHRVGAVAIPFMDVNRSSEMRQKAPDNSAIYAAYAYIGTAHAVRKELFLALGGYREILIHQCEEEDYCMRLLNAGYITRCGNADPIHHFESPRRNWTRMDYYGSRNKVLYAWHNVPFPYAVAHLGVTTAQTLAYTLRPNRLGTRLRAVMSAYGLACTGKCDRRPISPAIYRLSRKLKQRYSVPLDEIEALLPPAMKLGNAETQKR